MRRCVTRFLATSCGQRHKATGAWTLISNLQNLYAAKEFERQVISRLASEHNHSLYHMPEYRISDGSIADFEASKKSFLSKYFETTPILSKPGEVSYQAKEGYAWPMPKQMRPQVNQLIQADLFLKVPAGFKPSTLFCDGLVEKIAPDPLPHAYLAPLEEPGVVLCEVSEKPSDILHKALQILRAVKCCSFPEGALPCIAVICVNGSEDDAKNASASLFAGLEGGKIGGIPLVVTWTPYRNTYAEIRMLHEQLRDVNEKIAHLDTRMSGLEKGVSDLTDMMKVLLERK